MPSCQLCPLLKRDLREAKNLSADRLDEICRLKEKLKDANELSTRRRKALARVTGELGAAQREITTLRGDPPNEAS